MTIVQCNVPKDYILRKWEMFLVGFGCQRWIDSCRFINMYNFATFFANDEPGEIIARIKSDLADKAGWTLIWNKI